MIFFLFINYSDNKLFVVDDVINDVINDVIMMSSPIEPVDF